MKMMEKLEDLAERYDLVVVGAGPAGLAAAAKASEFGLSILIVDENTGPGGQIYRAITTTPTRRSDILGPSYWQGLELVHALEKASCHYAPQTIVWSVESARDDDAKIIVPRWFDVGVSSAGKARMVRARRLILATGALERPYPVPGWTLPGVMTAGAAQIALKASGLVPQGRTVLAGSGPLLLLLADQLKRAGANIIAVLETTPACNVNAALPLLADFLSSSYAFQGLKLWAKSRYFLPVRSKVSDLVIIGDGRVERVSYQRNGQRQSIDCDQILLHQGVIPNINMASALGCGLRWDPSIHAWSPIVDEWFETTVEGIAIAGDGAGIAGAPSAVMRGQIAAIAAACALGQVDRNGRDKIAGSLKSEARRLSRGRRFIDALYRPATEALRPKDPSTVICRCEEIRAAQIRKTVQDLHVQGPNQLKAYLRTGMGPCQGRMCGPSVIELIAEQRGLPVAEVGHLRLRMPVKPITLEELASMPQSEAAKNAVVR